VAAAEEGVRRAADTQAFGLGQVHDLARLGHAHAQRLLGMDMLAGVENRQAHVGVRQRHGQVDHDLDVVALQQLVDPHCRHAERRGLFLGGGAAHVGDRAQFEIGEALRRLEIGCADDPTADDAKSNLLHGQLRCTVSL
jgi:hypothetical protein